MIKHRNLKGTFNTEGAANASFDAIRKLLYKIFKDIQKEDYPIDLVNVHGEELAVICTKKTVAYLEELIKSCKKNYKLLNDGSIMLNDDVEHESK